MSNAFALQVGIIHNN